MRQKAGRQPFSLTLSDPRLYRFTPGDVAYYRLYHFTFHQKRVRRKVYDSGARAGFAFTFSSGVAPTAPFTSTSSGQAAAATTLAVAQGPMLQKQLEDGGWKVTRLCTVKLEHDSVHDCCQWLPSSIYDDGWLGTTAAHTITVMTTTASTS